jgi:hypothetical protein
MITGAETAHLTTKIPTIYLEGKLPLVVERTAAELGLKDGQVIQATVDRRPEGLRLNLLDSVYSGKHIDLPKELPPGLRLAAGDTVLFRVQLQNDGAIVLRPLQTQAAALPAQATATPPLPNRLQQLLFRPPDMNALAMLLSPGRLENILRGLNSASPELLYLQSWLRSRPSMAHLSPEKLQQWMERSGWFNENLLSKGQGAGQADLKTSLRQLLRLMQGMDAQEVGRVQDALDDIESRQLTAAESLTGREMVFSMMLPFVDAEPVAMRFVRQRRQPGQGKAPFIIHLHTRNRSLGEVWLQTRISNETDVDMIMWALREDIVKRAKDMTVNLANELDSAGLNMTRLLVVHGPGPSEPIPWQAPQQGSLIDVQT